MSDWGQTHREVPDSAPRVRRIWIQPSVEELKVQETENRPANGGDGGALGNNLS